MTPATTNYAEIQRDEMDVLHSIYMDDFIEDEVKTGAWNVGSNDPLWLSRCLSFLFGIANMLDILGVAG